MECIDCERIAMEDWSNVDFGDKRLNDRAASIGLAFLRSPFTSPPKMINSKKGLKGFYRFMDSDKVTHEKLIEPHAQQARSHLSSEKVVLCVQDSCTISLDRNYEIEGVYDVGNIDGIVIHNTISVIPHLNYGLVDGLLHQIVHKRKPKGERVEDDSESRLWRDSINAVGKPPAGTTLIDVMDRGADGLEVMHCSIDAGHEFILRVNHDRIIKEKDFTRLFDLARSLPSAGQYSLPIQGREGKKDRTSLLDVSFSQVNLPAPKNKQHLKPLSTTIIRVHENNPQKDESPIEWFLFTSLEVTTLEKALEIIRFYTYRWIIEEYHKCLKTGFHLEKTQLKKLSRIEALIGFTSVSSVRLLQLRDIVRSDPTADATKYVKDEDVKIVKSYYKVKESTMTIDTFLRYIAQMGGFLNRKSDGNPGWQSLWEGWKLFLWLKEGVRLARESPPCG